MFNRKPKERSLVEVKSEHNALVTTRVSDIASGDVSLGDLDISVSKYPRQSRRADEGPNDLNVLAQAILDNTPASQMTPKIHSFLMNMMSYGDITEKQKKFILDLAVKYLGEEETVEAA